MTKIKKRRRAKKYNYQTNRRKQNMKAKKLPTIEEKSIKTEWNQTKSLRYNMESMGLSFDPNNSVSNGQFNKASAKSSHQVPLQNKEAVRKGLEEKAALPEAFNLRLSEPETQYAIYMMEKYGEDYKAMARDKRNYYQDTPKQIQKKIQKFQKIPDLYDAYKVMKEQEVQSGNR